MEWSPRLVVRLLLGLVALSLVSSHVVFRKQLTLKYRHLKKHLKRSKHKLDAMPEDDPRAAAIDDAMDRLVNLIQDVSKGGYPCVQPDAVINIDSDMSVVATVPKLFRECKKKYAKTPMTEQNANIWCLRDSLWKYQFDQSVTVSSQAETKTNSTYTKSRSKRNVHWDNLIEDLDGDFEHPRRGGFRTRQEYRTLSRRQRRRFHRALRRLYRDGTFQKFAEVHREALNLGGAHGGRAFLSWHRAFISLFEEQLRRVSRNRVSLPYWDSSIDRRMGSLAWRSMMWHEDYMGEGVGEVDNGPFDGWVAPTTPLRRDVGDGGGLIRRRHIRRFMRQCQFANAHSGWEFAHNNVHIWVGGTMSGPNAANDPVFYLHHCFIDYQWEKFREHQRDDCGIDPSQDYPDTNDGDHQAGTPMVGMEFLQNRDGIADFWTDNWFGYEDTPTCPDCGGSQALFCHERRNRCIPYRIDDDDRRRRKKREAAQPYSTEITRIEKTDSKVETIRKSSYNRTETKTNRTFVRRVAMCGSNPYLATCPQDPAPDTPEEVVDDIWTRVIPNYEEVNGLRKAADDAKRKIERIPPDTGPDLFPEFPEPECGEGEDEDDDDEEEEGEYSMTRETSVYRYLERTVKRRGYQTTELGPYGAPVRLPAIYQEE